MESSELNNELNKAIDITKDNANKIGMAFKNIGKVLNELTDKQSK